MDPLTHAALGAACSLALFGKSSKSIPWQVGGLAAMAPDLDIFIPCQHNVFCLELWHRSFSHGLLFIPLGGLLVGMFFLCIPWYRRLWKITLGSAIVGYATHGLLDAFTSYGTCLLWPLSYKRFSFDVIAIVDPLFTIILILGIVWTIIHKAQKGVVLSLFFVGLFLLFNHYQHERAIDSIVLYAKKRNLNLTDLRALPNLASSTQWRGIAKAKNCLFISEIHTPLFKKSSLFPLSWSPLFDLETNRFSDEVPQELKTFLWFTDDYTILANTNPLILADGRYTIGKNKLYSLWGLKYSSETNHIDKVKFIVLPKYCKSPSNG